MAKQKLLLLFIIGILSLIVLWVFYTKEKINVFQKNMFYMDTMIQVKVYINSKNHADKLFENIEEIYRQYHQLSDRYNEYDELHNIYYLNNNTSDAEYITIDSKLYELLEYGLEWYEKSGELLDINMGCIIETWKNYFVKADGIPSTEELDLCTHINPIILGDDYTVLNNHPNIDLGSIAKGFATQKVSEYLESAGVTNYLINAGGNVIVGDHYNGGNYKIGIENPNDKSIYKILNVTNKAIVTSGGYERFYEFDGKQYSHIIDPRTKYPANYMKSVTVIANDSAFADALTTTLFLMPIDVGQNFVKDMDVDVIWYSNDDTIITTDGVKNYE